MFWRILPHATCCVSAQKLFLLDRRQDRYFAVPRPLEAPTLEWLERGFACAPPEEVTVLLVRAGILRPGDSQPSNALKERVPVPAAIDDLMSHERSILPKAQQSAAILATWMRLRLLSLHHILEVRQQRGALPARGHEREVASLAASYEAGRSYTPITRNCLLDSLTLDRLLATRGLGVSLVFGVCPTPFSAHCWLQNTDRVLNDSFDHVSRFTPIYAA
jgi:hypothetical protein